MAAIRLVEYACRDTISVLKVLLAMAVKGQLRGLIILYRTADGRENTVYTGAYKADYRQAAGAAMSMSLDLMRASGELDAGSSA